MKRGTNRKYRMYALQLYMCLNQPINSNMKSEAPKRSIYPKWEVWCNIQKMNKHIQKQGYLNFLITHYIQQKI